MFGMIVSQLLRGVITAGAAEAGKVKLRDAGIRLAWFVAVGALIGLLLIAALGCFGGAIWYAIAPKLGFAAASAITGAAFAVSAVVLWLAVRHWYLLPSRRVVAAAEPAINPLEALIPVGLEVAHLVKQHAGTLVLAAFAAGLFSGRRR